MSSTHCTTETPEYYRFKKPANEVADITIGMPHAIACAIEYLYRAGKKTECPIEDMKKAVWWVNRQINEIEKDATL